MNNPVKKSFTERFNFGGPTTIEELVLWLDSFNGMELLRPADAYQTNTLTYRVGYNRGYAACFKELERYMEAAREKEEEGEE